ncbi:hypothetical protein VNO77_10177 [Canavalia gladiata]|uniref:Ribosome maturation factor RimP N-terminal domain-containing protein n=1 Tax=Canavalia gladiata TaxID=3824 RepID=A0AAN9MFK4_CANGL
MSRESTGVHTLQFRIQIHDEGGRRALRSNAPVFRPPRTTQACCSGMDLISGSWLSPGVSVIPPAPLNSIISTRTNYYAPPPSARKFSFRCCNCTSPYYALRTITRKPLIPTPRAKKRNSDSEPVLEPSIVQEVSLDEEEDDDFLDEFELEYEASVDDEEEDDGVEYYDEEEEEYEGDEYKEEDSVPYVGDGGAGGGISLAGTWWDKKALSIAKEVAVSFDGDLQIYAFKTLLNSTILVRIEKLTNKSGSPSMEDIEAFSATYRAKLDEAELAKFVPDNLSLEVSSPGVERIVRIPDDLDRFKDRPMYVKYVTGDDSNNPSAEGDGVFRLESFDMETKCCTWGLADVKVNRPKAGKGRPLSKKQREWRLSTPFDSLRFVRLHSDI